MIAVLEAKAGTGTRLQAPQFLADACVGGVLDVTRAEGARVLERETMLEVLKATGGKCVEGECELETARYLNVDLFVTWLALNVDGEFMLTLKVFETKGGVALGQEQVAAPTERELIALTRPASARLMRQALGVGNSGIASPQVRPTVPMGRFGEVGKDVALGDGETVLVKFESEPEGASVRLDGELLCSVAPCSKRIAGGRHEVVFEKERYSAAKLVATAAKGAVVKGTLQPKFGWLSVETDVPGISVTVDGAEAGKTPITAREVDSGPVEVAVSDRCYVRTGERFAMKAGERKTLRLAATPRMAGLKVNAVDGRGNDLEAAVRVDGREAGEAGVALKVSLCAREASVRVGGNQWSESLKLEEGRVTVLTARFNTGAGSAVSASGSGTGYLTLFTEPMELKVMLGSQLLGETPLLKVPIPVGSHQLRLVAVDGRSTYLMVGIREGETTATRKTVTFDEPATRSSPVAGMVSVAGGGGVRPFKLDVTEVTVAAYAACVKTGKCTEPGTGFKCNWSVGGKEQHPINCVDWMQADAYCKAQGKRLPDQTEWQFAASNGGRTQFPWGDSSPDVTRAKWTSSDGTAPVGSFPAGATQSGLQDLSGNVWEWMANDYDGVKELRGGSWLSNNPDLLRASDRYRIGATFRFGDVGFRCAQ
jgi:hypothetical protein